ncbi:uncharacterized protein [Dermacentor andersoni]|uniref:uncharacterized protein n=1 Tax=Dermacentor andersoni TaxID=34620 RepID=UPI003B3ACC17
MFAVVRYTSDFDGKLHVIPASDIKNFRPQNNLDFDKLTVYSVFWRDPVDGENTGYYNAQVLMLAETEAEVRRRMDSKRLQKPKIRADLNSSSDEGAETAESTTQRKKVEKKRKRARTVIESGSSDSDSDSLCALSELKAAQDKAQVWKARAMEYKEERDYLRDRVISLEKCLESKIFQSTSLGDELACGESLFLLWLAHPKAG